MREAAPAPRLCPVITKPQPRQSRLRCRMSANTRPAAFAPFPSAALRSSRPPPLSEDTTP